MNLKRHHVLYGLLAILCIVGIVFLTFPRPELVSFKPTDSTAPASSTTEAMRFEVVTGIADQERGLGGRADIPQNYGMLFAFAKPDRYGFWMKDMLAPIDMIWLSDSGEILGIDASVAPSTYPQAYYPPRPVRYVLETRAGEAARRGWGVGTHIELPLPYGKYISP